MATDPNSGLNKGKSIMVADATIHDGDTNIMLGFSDGEENIQSGDDDDDHTNTLNQGVPEKSPPSFRELVYSWEGENMKVIDLDEEKISQVAKVHYVKSRGRKVFSTTMQSPIVPMTKENKVSVYDKGHREAIVPLPAIFDQASQDSKIYSGPKC